MIATAMLGYSALCMAEMGSQNYRVSADTINGAGNLSESANYNLGDSLGETAVGVEGSANYKSKTAFWYMLPEGSQLGLSCEASDVYMVDYALGNANDYNKHLFSSAQQCTVTDNSSAPWSLTMQSTDMTSAKNNLPNSNVFLVTDGNESTGDTITSPTTGIDETAGTDHVLSSPQTIINGDASADGVYTNRPTVKLSNLNTLYSEALTGTLTITIQ